ncbi:MAG: hypothetical protein ACRDQ5_22545, partial [Sciscionella sp.]
MSTQDSGYSTGRFSSDEAATSILPPSATREGAGGKSAPAAHAGIDFGLLVLRLAIGGTVGAHGLQKVFGLAGGQGIDGFTTTLRS